MNISKTVAGPRGARLDRIKDYTFVYLIVKKIAKSNRGNLRFLSSKIVDKNAIKLHRDGIAPKVRGQNKLENNAYLSRYRSNG